VHPYIHGRAASPEYNSAVSRKPPEQSGRGVSDGEQILVVSLSWPKGAVVTDQYEYLSISRIDLRRPAVCSGERLYVSGFCCGSSILPTARVYLFAAISASPSQKDAASVCSSALAPWPPLAAIGFVLDRVCWRFDVATSLSGAWTLWLHCAHDLGPGGSGRLTVLRSCPAHSAAARPAYVRRGLIRPIACFVLVTASWCSQRFGCFLSIPRRRRLRAGVAEPRCGSVMGQYPPRVLSTFCSVRRLAARSYYVRRFLSRYPAADAISLVFSLRSCIPSACRAAGRFLASCSCWSVCSTTLGQVSFQTGLFRDFRSPWRCCWLSLPLGLFGRRMTALAPESALLAA